MIKNNLLLLASIFFTNYGFTSPNILIILADDLGWNDVSYHGSEIKTPNIDQIRNEGIRFDNFYANSPECSPTRASLISGLYPHKAGVPGVIRTNKKNNCKINDCFKRKN